MPELKRNFLKGKMNKDLDERLVPNGEYRDALNVEITTSEDSDVGSVQNVKGNEYIETVDYTLSSSAISVGNYVDKKNSCAYNFIRLASNLTSDTGFNDYVSKPRYLGTRSDAIIRFTENKSTEQSESKVVFCDVYEARVVPNAFTGTLIEGLEINTPLYIRPGMRVQAIDLNGNDLWGAENDVRVVSAPWASLAGTTTGTVNITSVLNVDNIYTQAMIDAGVVIRFTAEKILNFRPGTFELEQNNKNSLGVDVNSSKTYTPKQNIITGINVIDNLLYFTDDYDEPKKININQCIKGSGRSLSTALKHHTRLVVDKDGESINYGHIKKSHVTLIKPSPTRAPRVKGFNSAKEGVTSAYLYSSAGSVFDLSPNGVLLNDTGYSTSDTIQLSTGQVEPNWNTGNVITMTGVTSGIEVGLVVEEKINANTFVFQVRTIPSSYTVNTAPELWLGKLFEKEYIYEDKFVSFAYRYKYADNEYSVISPYSKPLFIPGKYNYDPISGFNIGMTNQLKRVEVYDYIPYSIPKDVVSVELLYRETQSINVYLVHKVDFTDAEWSESLEDSKHKGKIVIDSQLFGSAIPTNQVDRLQDNVPVKAKAQEITASRLMFGNYVENYDLIDDAGDPVKAKLSMTLSSTNLASEMVVDSANICEASQSTALSNSYNVDGDTSASALSFDLEAIDGDVGENFNATNSYYDVPVTGSYTFDISCKWRANNGVVGQTAVNVDKYMWIFPWAYLELRDYDTNEPILSMGAPVRGDQYNNGSPASHSSFKQFANDSSFYSGQTNPRATAVPQPNGTTTWWTNNYDVGQPTWLNYKINLTLNKSVELAAGTKVYVAVVAQDPTDNTNLPQGVISNGTNEYTYVWSNGTLPLDTWSWVNANHVSEISNGSFRVTQAPENNGTFNVTSGAESVKTQRKYQLGVVYRDAYNRQSTVLIDKDATLKVAKENSEKANKITARVISKAPRWATYYKYFIKESASVFHNIVMSSAYLNNDATSNAEHIWISFNSDDIDKIQKGDTLAAKKGHGTNVAANSPLWSWKVLDISRQSPVTGDGITPLIADASETTGKFFVKIARDIYTDAFLGSNFPKSPNPNGAVFEVQTLKTIDSDIYYEVGNAYPIRLDINNLSEFIDIGAKVTCVNIVDPPPAAYRNLEEIRSDFNNKNLKVKGLVGARSFGSGIEVGDYYSSAVVSVDQNVDLVLDPEGYITLAFENKDGSVVTLRLSKSASGKDLYCKPVTHSYGSNNGVSFVTLPWYNCISFGNGVESDTINDDFNANKISLYTSVGRLSAFNTNYVFADYKQERKLNDIIFSQIYNEKSGVNRFNEFLIGEGIVKQLTDEHGSIQKLFARDTDLLAFCENKVLKIYANKDILYNADGNSQLTATRNVLGSFKAYSGDYGIGNNPESLAVDQYRIYFADKDKSSILRLSGDGLTVISDYGMSDWFGDNLEKAQSLVGSFDEDKGVYNLTVQEVTSPGYKKNVYTISFSDRVNGWPSFKSFIQEQGFTLNNSYYTMNKGKIYKHQSNNVNRNEFYGNQYNSSITPIINDFPGSVKSFTTINYEGTQSKVDLNTQDGKYHNLTAKDGWYVDYITTDQQRGKVSEFINKEGKWFNNILGDQTQYTNPQQGSTALNNLDLQDFSVQGLGVPTSVSGTTTGFGHKLSVVMAQSGTGWESDGFVEYNVTDKTSGDIDTFVISPLPGYQIAASGFTDLGPSAYVNSITYSDAGTPNTSDNTILVTINWKTITLGSETTINIPDAGDYSLNTFIYETILSIYRDPLKADVSITSLAPSIDDSVSGDVDSGANISLYSENVNNVESYSVQGVTEQNIPTNLYKVTLQAKPGLYYFTQPSVEFSEAAQENNSFEVLSETVQRNELDLIVSKTVIIKYNPTQDVFFDDNINVGFGGGIIVSSYAIFQSNQVVISDLAQNVILPFDTNVGYITFSATSSDGVNAAVVSTTNSSVEVALTANVGVTGSPRTFTINLFSSFNPGPTPNDTIVIVQTESAQSYVDITTTDGSDALTATANVDLDPLFLVNGTYLLKYSLYLYTNGSAPVTDVTFASNQSWANTFVIYETDDPNIYIGRVALDINNTGASRTATITLTHSDTITTDTLVITQEAYNSTTDTALFDDADNFINVVQAGSEGVINITTTNTNGYAPTVELLDADNTLSEYIMLGDVIEVAADDYSISYSILPNESIVSKTFTLKMYHPLNRTPNATPNATLFISQDSIPYASFEPTQGIQGQIELSGDGETDYELNVNHNDYAIGDDLTPNTRFLAYNSVTELYDIDITASPGIAWIPYADVSWTNSANNVDGNGILQFDASANSSGSARNVILGVFHSNNSSSTPDDTITINQTSV